MKEYLLQANSSRIPSVYGYAHYLGLTMRSIFCIGVALKDAFQNNGALFL